MNKRPLVQGEKVRVYRNLHNHLLSVQSSNGRVIAHVHSILLKDVKFVVRPAGRRKVLETRKKNVHAFAFGTFFDFASVLSLQDLDNPVRVTYNPYRAETFMREDGLPILKVLWCR